MSALLLAIKKLIAILTAIFIPTATAAPAVMPQHSRVVTVSIFDSIKSDDNTAPHVEEGEQLEPVAEWDVSATENDNVTMSFFDTEDADSLIEQLAGRVTALFAPMTAYAAEEGGFTVDNGNTKVDFTELPDAGGDGEFGQPGDTDPEAYAPVRGTVVVSGTGDMVEAVYNNFIDPLRYLETIVDLFKEEGITATCEYNGLTDINEIAAAATDVMELDANIVWRNAATGEEVNVSDTMRETLNPANMLKYSPVEIIIDEGVTNVSDYAFALCANIEKVTIPEGVTSIGQFAFAYCTNLKTVELPSTLERIGNQAFNYCTSLDNIVIPQSVTSIDCDAFTTLKDGATVVMPNQDLKDDYEKYSPNSNCNIVVADTAETVA